MTDFFAAAQRVISILIQGSEISIITWLASGGIIYLLRGISFWIDNLIVNFIGSLYTYFMKLLNGTLFNETVVNELLKNVYLFIGIVIFFRLAMILIKYIMNPELVSDEKAGVNSLIKRVIIGLIGILLVPFIFDNAIKFQGAIIDDQLIQQLIMPKDMINAVSEKSSDAGKQIGTYILAGFFNPSTNASYESKKDYTIALENGDFSSLDFNKGGFLGVGYTTYEYSYFYLLSTFVLGYVLYLMLKYCLDIVVRFFKLLLYELLAPVAFVEYMISGSENGMFKNWKNAVLGTYFMLFVRVLSIWFVVLVMALMSGEYASYTDGTLLIDNDYLLRALIIIGLLAFMIDLPKIISNIFGIDLEQESSATNVLKTAGGIFKGVGGAAALAGGAAIGSAFGKVKAGAQGRKEINQARKAGELTPEKLAKIKQNTKSAQHAAGLAGLKGVGKAAMSVVPGANAFSQGFAGSTKAVAEERSNQKAAEEKEKNALLQKRQMEQSEKQTGYARKAAAMLGVKDSNDADLTAINEAMKEAGQSTLSEQLSTLNTTSEVTRDHVVNIKDNVKEVANTTNDISRNVETAVNTTQTIAQNTDTIVNQTANISHKVDQIEDNTFYSGIDAIESLDLRDSSSGSNDTIGGVSVSKPDSLTGERTTASGFVVPGSVDIDNK